MYMYLFNNNWDCNQHHHTEQPKWPTGLLILLTLAYLSTTTNLLIYQHPLFRCAATRFVFCYISCILLSCVSQGTPEGLIKFYLSFCRFQSVWRHKKMKVTQKLWKLKEKGGQTGGLRVKGAVGMMDRPRKWERRAKAELLKQYAFKGPVNKPQTLHNHMLMTRHYLMCQFNNALPFLLSLSLSPTKG